ncbi:MAG: UDP-glucose 4-epimerase [candidate division WS2 bacterium ADurb.Bin280]|uniref:UDP-glucose 4-epimerase n=1 Tax=candidate division WS2 bacterium ADurb.Bin280 TaxID=1852829 RepID=A0A1V5SBX8_9BACT|nr:MAG: UDP-glucose 4-epimerase [candidate division WS2 bacterium ADurb.Bin280]
MSKIIVTGGAGFIGSNLVDALIKENHEVTVIDNLSTGSRENLNSKATFFETDITDYQALEEIFEKFRPETIFHLAAQASVIVSCQNPAKDVEVNVIGTINLLQLAEKFEVKKFIFSSTGGAIYGDDAPRPTTEDAKERPASPYGMDKLSAERYIEFFAKRSSMTASCLRYANVYGPRQNSKGEAGVIAIFIDRMLKNEPVHVYGDGSHTRDYVFVSDVVKANLKAIEVDKGGTYNIGTGKETTVNEIVEALREEISTDSEIINTPYKSEEQAASSLDAKKALNDLGWAPTIELEEGMKKVVEWFKNNTQK